MPGWFSARLFSPRLFRTALLDAPPPARVVTPRPWLVWPLQRLRWPAKRPAETVAYGIEWSRLLSAGDAVERFACELPAELTEVGRGLSGTLGVVVLAGGAAGVRHRIVCSAETAAGLVLERAVLLDVVDH